MECLLCDEKEYNLEYCYSCYKLICINCYQQLEDCPYCRFSYSEHSPLEKITILLNLIENKSPKIDIDHALYRLSCFKSIKKEEDLEIFYLKRSNYAAIYNQLGCIYWKKNEEEKAIEYFKKGAEKKYPTAMINLGEEYFKKEKYEEAKKLFLEADERFFTNEDMDDKNFYLGIIYFKEGNFREAKKCLEASNDKDKRKYIYLSKIYHIEGNYELAVYNIKLTEDEDLIKEYMPYDRLKNLYDNSGEERNSKKIKLINDILDE